MKCFASASGMLAIVLYLGVLGWFTPVRGKLGELITLDENRQRGLLKKKVRGVDRVKSRTTRIKRLRGTTSLTRANRKRVVDTTITLEDGSKLHVQLVDNDDTNVDSAPEVQNSELRDRMPDEAKERMPDDTKITTVENERFVKIIIDGQDLEVDSNLDDIVPDVEIRIDGQEKKIVLDETAIDCSSMVRCAKPICSEVGYTSMKLPGQCCDECVKSAQSVTPEISQNTDNLVNYGKTRMGDTDGNIQEPLIVPVDGESPPNNFGGTRQ